MQSPLMPAPMTTTSSGLVVDRAGDGDIAAAKLRGSGEDNGVWNEKGCFSSHAGFLLRTSDLLFACRPTRGVCD